MNNETNKFILDLIQETTTTTNWVKDNNQIFYFDFLHKGSSYQTMISKVDAFKFVINNDSFMRKLTYKLSVRFNEYNNYKSVFNCETDNIEDTVFIQLKELYECVSKLLETQQLEVMDSFLENLNNK